MGRRVRRGAALAALWVMGLCGAVAAQTYPVSELVLDYVSPAALPPLPEARDALRRRAFDLVLRDGVLTTPAPGEAALPWTPEQLDAAAVVLDGPALRAIVEGVRQDFGERGRGVFVAPHPQDIDPGSGADLRPPGERRLRLSVIFDGPTIMVSRFDLAYANPGVPGLPPLAQVSAEVSVPLARSAEGTLVAWRPGPAWKPLRLSELPAGQHAFSAGAVQAVLEAVSAWYKDRGYMVVWAVPAAGELGDQAQDTRPGGRTDLRIDVVLGVVSGVRTLASGERVPVEERVNHPAHRRILEGSPFQPGPLEEARLIRRDELDGYLHRVSRHPGRRVDAAVTPGTAPYTVGLDYLVRENKPLRLYGQVSNTGTRQTDSLRWRFGLFTNQLTGSDDILSLEYITAGFDESHAVVGSYDARLLDSDTLRWRAYGNWSEYTASDVGFAAERFSGQSWSLGGEVAWNVMQQGPLFVDLVGGMRFVDIEVTNEAIATTGQDQFILPYAGARWERVTDLASTDGSVLVEFNDNFTGSDVIELNRLGRLFPDEDWLLLRWDSSLSFFLEPLLWPEAWRDLSTPGSSTLAHEVYARFRGQYAFDQRLVPQFEQVAGGLYSVRGYPESAAVGDTVLIATAEYRLHLPRALPYSEEPGRFMGRPMPLLGTNFRWVPQQPYGRADWDLVLKGFVDAARTINSNPFSFEQDQTLVSAGIGAELTLRSNLAVRVDWGIALDEIAGTVDSGSSRVHFAASIFY
jgi:hemolysin activation/secretion protein